MAGHLRLGVLWCLASEMSRLTDPSHWNSKYGESVPVVAQPASTPFRRWLHHIGRSYAAEHLFNFHLGRSVKPGPLKIIEIGSAPGGFLKECHTRFGFEPYGVEYSPLGASVNRENFNSWGLDPNNVFESDFFANDFQSAHRAEFDVVVSRGFIEHFTDLPPVIDAHVNLLKPGGTLVITIPNYSGLNYMLGLLTVRMWYPLHNIDLMRKKAFGKLFVRPDLDTLFCGYGGGVDFGILEGGPKAPNGWLLKVTRPVQWGLNVVFNSLFFDHVPETRYTSPYLLYMGRKKAA